MPGTAFLVLVPVSHSMRGLQSVPWDPVGKYVRPAFLEDSGDFQTGAKPLHLYFAFVGVFFSNIPSLNQSCHY